MAAALGMETYSYNSRSIRDLEIGSIRSFVEHNAYYLTGRVLDFGAGKPGTCREPQPYRSLVPGDYHSYDIGDPFPIRPFDSILCTQVLQYVEDPKEQIKDFANLLSTGGHLVLTYSTNWDEVETSDLWRFTKQGMEQLIELAGFEILVHERRAEVNLNGFRFPLGYGLVAKKLKPHYVPDQEASAFFLTEALKRQKPFLFLRFGDGMIECMDFPSNIGGSARTCDGEEYSQELGRDLLKAWNTALENSSGLYVGDWLSASFTSKARDRNKRYEKRYRQLLGKAPVNPLHYEALLFHSNRPGTERLVEFWAAVKSDSRRKLLLGPPQMSQAAKLLGAQLFPVPMGGLYKFISAIKEDLENIPFDILLWGAGMASNIPIIELRKQFPDRTYINIGSALDPIFRKRSRTQQMTKADASVTFYKAVGLLP